MTPVVQQAGEPTDTEPVAFLITLTMPGKRTQYASVYPYERRDDVDDAMWASRVVQPLGVLSLASRPQQPQAETTEYEWPSFDEWAKSPEGIAFPEYRQVWMTARKLRLPSCRPQPQAETPSEKPIAWWSGGEYGGGDEHGRLSLGTFTEHEDTWHDIPVYAGWNNEGKPSRTDPAQAETPLTDERQRYREALREMLRYFDKPRLEEWCNEVEWRRACGACQMAHAALALSNTGAHPPGAVSREDFDKMSADLTRAKNLLVRLHSKFPETRSQIEGSTGTWFIWGTDRDAASPLPPEAQEPET